MWQQNNVLHEWEYSFHMNRPFNDVETILPQNVLWESESGYI